MADYTINYEEITEYLKLYKSTQDAKHKKHLQDIIAFAAMPLVKKIARGLARRNTDPVEDIIQVGSVGLVKAIQLYNPKVSENFKTYATYLITGEIRHYLRDKVSMIKAPREIYELAYRVNKLMQKLKDDQGNEPSEIVLAEELGTSVCKIKEVIDVERRKQTISLDQIINTGSDESLSLFDKIADDNHYNLESFQEDKILINGAISKLEEKLQEVIIMNYFEDMSQTQIASKLGISQMQVSRRLKKALNKLLIILSEKEGKV
ncbi:MAG: sigma-70 family RNA polymerase sigma factor [Candidatus Gastranaerophilales bacterium]|nr:sigma-70 family RNA polymerase sigma factor [Candidatus Gastranaerophilales bacterium]